MMKTLILMAVSLFLLGCQLTEQERISRLVKKWIQKEIIIPEELNFNINGTDSLLTITDCKSTYKILVYVDSSGCVPCKLQLPLWQEFIQEVISSTSVPITSLFVMNTDNNDAISDKLLSASFKYPVCFDQHDILNRINRFPENEHFHFFLLDINNRVITLGSPISSTYIWNNYLMELSNQVGASNISQTTNNHRNELLDFGILKKGEIGIRKFVLKNQDTIPMVITHINTGCRCISVHHDNKPLMNEEAMDISIHYHADTYGPFSKMILVYLSNRQTPLKLELKGSIQ